ncbi:MAG: hypothetical protein IT458_05725 [Planctomycetes bacterium]|nr:hypothetical protein [Planctomycetota bacterium]
MVRLPLASVLYGASALLLAGSAWLFYEAIQTGRGRDPRKAREELQREAKELLERGAGREADDLPWSYQDDRWWGLLRDANWTGKLPPQAETRKADTEVPKVVPKSQRPLPEIFNVIAIVHGADETGCWVRYKPGSDVKPPPEMVRTTPAVFAPTPQVPGRGAPAPLPRGPVETEILHHVELEKTLWPPYEHIRLVRVAEDARSVFFLREDATVAREQWKEEEVIKNELDLPEEILQAVRRGTARAGSANTGTRPSQPRETPRPGDPRNQPWVSVPETKEIEPGRWMLSEQDNDYLAQNVDRILEQDISLRSYESPRGNYRGVMLERVGGDLARFGVQSGDVILSVNGTKVGNRAELINEGRKQYDRGTRTFEVEVLSRGRVETRTWTAPERKR